MIKITAMTTMCADVFDGCGRILPGGEALNFAANACKFPYISVGLLGAIGDDEIGREILRSMENKPVDTSSVYVIKGGRTASNRIYLTAEGDRYFKEDSWDDGVYGTFLMSEEDRQRVCTSDIVFITCYSPNFGEVISLKEKSDFKLASDFDVRRDFEEMEKLLPHIDYFLISGSEDILPVFAKWSEKYHSIINVTRGAEGSVTYHKGRTYRVKALPVPEVEDTTGCGDSYHAAFICSHAKDGDITAAMNAGSAAASETLSHLGGFLY